MTQKETEILFRIVRDLKEKGTSFIYISHRLEEIFEICDRAVVLRDGEMVGETLIRDTSRPELIRMMIGRELSNYYPEHVSRATEEVVLRVENLSGNGAQDVSLELHKGEILGVAGLVGAGRTELMNVLFCNVPKAGGHIYIRGEEFQGKQPWHAIAQGVAYLPEDRKRLGLLMDKSIAVNTTLASIKRFCRFGVINDKKENECIRTYCEKLEVKTPSYDKEVQHLSGGNKTNYQDIDRLADEGHSILMVSSEFEELIGVADRIVVMSEGRLVGAVGREQFDKELLLDMASGSR